MKTKFILSLFLLGLSVNSHSQVIINKDTCVARAIRHSEDVQIAESQRRQSTYMKREQRSHFFPKLSASGLYLHYEKETKFGIDDTYLPTMNFNPVTGSLEPNLLIGADGNPVYDGSGNPIFNSYAFLPAQEFAFNFRQVYQYGLTVEQPIFMGGKILSANKMASIGEQIAKINLTDKKQQIRLDAEKTYWQYVAVSEQVKVAEKYVELLDSLLIHVSEAVDAGLAHRNQLLKVQVKRNQAQLQLEKAQNGRELLRLSLCQKMDMALDTRLMTSDSTIEIAPVDFEILAKGTPQDRPDYQMLEKIVKLKKSNESLVRSDFLPQIGVQASYNFLEGIKLNEEDFLKTDGGTSVLVSAKVPLFQWGEGFNKVKEAKMETEMARASLQKYQKLMTLEIEQAFLNLKEAFHRYETTQVGLEQAEENLRLSQDSYDVGLELITDHLEAQAQWQEAYANYIDAKAECKIKESEYQKAIGRL